MKDNETQANRNVRDTVFTHLFSQKKHLLELYQVLHPEDTETTEEDLDIITLSHVMVNDIHNDLGFRVKDRFIILAEAQTVWSDNIVLREFLYLGDTLKNYIRDAGVNVFEERAVELPETELYVVYGGLWEDVPEKISLRELYGEGLWIDAEVRVLKETGTDDILSQFIRFSQIVGEKRREKGNTVEALAEALEECENEGVLREYLAEFRAEVSSMIRREPLFDEEFLREAARKHPGSMKYHLEEEKAYARRIGHKQGLKEGLAAGREEGLTEGRAQGRAEGRAQGRAEGIAEGQMEGRTEAELNSVRALTKTMNWSAEQAMDALCIDPAVREKYLVLLAEVTSES